MSFNFAELQQKADRVLFNADQFVRRYIDFALAPARDVTIQYYDQNGNLQTFTVPNRQKLVNQLYADLPNSMVRTFYVHQTMGNDNNSGTQQQPFKSLQKAVDSVPTGGYGTIHLMSNYTLDHNLIIVGKTIVLRLEGFTLTTTYYGVQNGHAEKFVIRLTGSNLFFLFPGKIVVPQNPFNAPLAPVTYSLVSLEGYVTSVCFMSFQNPNYPNDYVFLEVHSGALVGYNQNNEPGYLSFNHVGFYSLHGNTAHVANNTFLIQTYGRPFSIGLSFDNNLYTGFLKRPNGTVITNFADVIGGIIRDNAGVPRNIISNKLL